MDDQNKQRGSLHRTILIQKMAVSPLWSLQLQMVRDSLTKMYVERKYYN